MSKALFECFLVYYEHVFIYVFPVTTSFPMSLLSTLGRFQTLIYFYVLSILYRVPTQPANIGPQDVLRTSPSNVPGRSLKILFDRPGDVPIWRPNLTSWRRPEMTSRRRLNPTFKERPWQVELGRPQDILRTSPRGSWEYSNLDV